MNLYKEMANKDKDVYFAKQQPRKDRQNILRSRTLFAVSVHVAPTGNENEE